MKDQASTPSTRSKKYYLKKQLVKQQPSDDVSSIFKITLGNQLSTELDTQNDSLKFLTSNSRENKSITTHVGIQDSTQFSSDRHSTLKHHSKYSNTLPRIDNSLTIGIDSQFQQVYLKERKKVSSIIRHKDDPEYIKNLENFERRAHNKYKRYRKKWNEMIVNRQNHKSLISTSIEKAQKIIKAANYESQKKKMKPAFSEMLRNEHLNKVYATPARINTAIQGIKGKGGKVVSIFQQYYRVEEVLKINKNKR